MKDLFSVNEKVVLVTGSGQGIGRSLAENMAELGAFVYCFDIKFPNNIPQNLIKNLFHVNCNITNIKKFQNSCKKIFTKHKKIDVLINNAGVTFPRTGNDMYTQKMWFDTMKINLTAAFTCSQIVIEQMIKNKKGSIINITSINAELGFPNNPAYVASKGGLKMLSKSFARDYGIYGIRVNNIGPGYFKTTMNQKSWNDKKVRKLRTTRTMLGRWGDPEELVGPCIFLASDASSYVTGQDLYVDGGWTTNGLSSN